MQGCSVLIQHSLQNGRSILVLARYFIGKLSNFLLVEVPSFPAVGLKDFAACLEGLGQGYGGGE